VHRQGKASAPYEFGMKASIVTNNRRAPGGLFVLHTRALPDNRKRCSVITFRMML
jgi:transposase, IS5 family